MWKVIGASVVGTSHQASGRPCEDASGWIAAATLTCLAVADGAGSRRRAERGSAAAVERAVQLAAEQVASGASGDPERWVRDVFVDIRDRLSEIAAVEGVEVDELATTLAVAAITPDALCVGQIGDTIAVVGAAGTFETVAPAPRFEYANETVFVTGADALNHLRLVVKPIDGIDEVFLSTDGLRFKILDLGTATPYHPFFEDVGVYVRTPDAAPDAVRSFLAGLDDQTGDDKSLVVAARCQPAMA
jgi:hypothetical protein